MKNFLDIYEDNFIDKIILVIPSWEVARNIDYFGSEEKTGSFFYNDFHSFKRIIATNKIFLYGNKLPIVIGKDDLMWLDETREFDPSLNYKDIKELNTEEYLNILYIDYDFVMKPFFEIFRDYQYEDCKNFIKDYISKASFVFLKKGLEASLFKLNKDGGYCKDLTRILVNQLNYKIILDCDSNIWQEIKENNEVCPVKEINIDKEKSKIKNKGNEKAIVFYSWDDLVKYEIINCLKNKSICANPECGKLLNLKDTNSYCMNNIECKRSRDRQRQRKMRIKNDV